MASEIRQHPTDAERLAQLWQARTSEAPFSDYPIGPGDVLEISVPTMEDLQTRFPAKIKEHRRLKVREMLPTDGTTCGQANQ